MSTKKNFQVIALLVLMMILISGCNASEIEKPIELKVGECFENKGLEYCLTSLDSEGNAMMEIRRDGKVIHTRGWYPPPVKKLFAVKFLKAEINEPASEEETEVSVTFCFE